MMSLCMVMLAGLQKSLIDSTSSSDPARYRKDLNFLLSIIKA